jgi:hypothetical protein
MRRKRASVRLRYTAAEASMTLLQASAIPPVAQLSFVSSARCTTSYCNRLERIERVNMSSVVNYRHSIPHTHSSREVMFSPHYPIGCRLPTLLSLKSLNSQEIVLSLAHLTRFDKAYLSTSRRCMKLLLVRSRVMQMSLRKWSLNSRLRARILLQLYMKALEKRQ